MTVLTNLTTGLLNSVISNVIYSNGISNINLLITGDSIASYIVDTPASLSQLETDLTSEGITTDVSYDGAQGGTVLVEEISELVAFWDFTNDEKSAIYDSLILPNEGTWTPTDVIISLGTNDADKVNGITNNITLANWVTAYKNYIAYLKQQFPTIERIYLKPIGRHITRNDGQLEWQSAREGQAQVADEVAGVYLMPQYWDADYTGDTVHPLDASYQSLISPRDAFCINAVANGNPTNGFGAKVTGAVVTDTGLTATITHVGGTDYTINGDPSDIFRATGNGIFNAVESVSKTNATTLAVNCGALTKPAILTTLYGTMDTIADDGSDNIRDNATPNMAIQYSQVTATDTDVIRNITNLQYEVRSSYAKTYDSGTNISSIVSANGRSFSNLNASNFMTYEASAFGGSGGLRSTAVNRILSANNGFAAQETAFFGMVIDVPATLSNAIYVFALGNSNSISSRAQFYINTSGQLYYAENQARGQEIITSDLRGGRHVILANYTSFTNLDVYVDDASSPVKSFDQDNAYGFQNDLFFGGGASAGVDYDNFFAKLGAHDAVNDPSLAAIMADLKSKNNIT